MTTMYSMLQQGHDGGWRIAGGFSSSNKTYIKKTPRLDGKEGEEYVLEVETVPFGEPRTVDRGGMPYVERDGIRTFQGEESGVQVKIIRPGYFSHWPSREDSNEYDVCTYCGTSNGYYSDNEYISLRQGFDCYSCGGN